RIAVVLVAFVLVCPEAIHAQKQKRKRKKRSPTVSQTMTNSPSGIQAGGNVTINPRPGITKTQNDAIVSALREHAPEPVSVLLFMANRDTQRVAKQIADALISSGWREVKIIPYAAMSISTFKGISILANDVAVRKVLT